MRILLATDGSEYGREAAAQCGELASEIDGAVVKIITVADFTAEIASEPFMSSIEFFNAIEDEMRKRSDAILNKAEEIVRFKNEDIEILREVFVGSAKKLIVKEAEKWNADLVIVGSHGYGVLARAVLGSVSNAVVNHAPCSVLVARKTD